MIEFLVSPTGLLLSIVVFIMFVGITFSRFLKKSSPGQALVKTGFGLKEPMISTSSAFVIPLLHKIESIDMTVKTVRISRRTHDSLSCADGIRAEVEVDFYIQINAVYEDIRRVATTVGCARASSIETIREIFEAKFSDALKTAGAKLPFDSLYQNRRQFRDEILKALGHEGEGEVILNGYKLDDVAIQFLEQLPLHSHDENNVLDAKGIKEIAMRTSLETEAANKRMRQKEVTIAEQNQVATTRQLSIEQDLSFKTAMQQREIAESKSKEKALAEKTLQEQERIQQEAAIEREKNVSIAEEKKQQEINIALKAKEQALQIAEEEKLKQIQLAKIAREIAEAEQLKAKLEKLEETAQQDAKKVLAEEQTNTTREVEVAKRSKIIEVIKAEKEAQVSAARKNVDSDVKAYELITIAQAKLKSAELDAQAAELQAKSIIQVGKAEAEALKAKLEAEGHITDKVIMNNALNKLIPLLPEIFETLMKPSEKIDSIKILNVSGMDKVSGQVDGAMGAMNNGNVGGSLIQTVMGMGMVMPVLKELVSTIKGDDRYKEMFDGLKNMPGGEMLMNYIEKGGQNKASGVM